MAEGVLDAARGLERRCPPAWLSAQILLLRPAVLLAERLFETATVNRGRRRHRFCGSPRGRLHGRARDRAPESSATVARFSRSRRCRGVGNPASRGDRPHRPAGPVTAIPTGRRTEVHISRLGIEVAPFEGLGSRSRIRGSAIASGRRSDFLFGIEIPALGWTWADGPVSGGHWRLGRRRGTPVERAASADAADPRFRLFAAEEAALRPGGDSISARGDALTGARLAGTIDPSGDRGTPLQSVAAHVKSRGRTAYLEAARARRGPQHYGSFSSSMTI
jgi:hypothetical protein